MANKKLEPGFKETKEGYRITPIKFGLFNIFFGIIIPIILMILAATFSMTWLGNIFGIIFLIYMLVLVTWIIKKRLFFFGSLIQKGENKYHATYESKGFLRQKELKIKK
jgi:hypothetical protein